MTETWNPGIPLITNQVAADILDIEENFDYLMAMGGYWVDYSEADQGAAGSGNSVKDLVDAIGTTKKATLLFKHNAADGDTTAYTFSTTESIPSNFILAIQNGSIITIPTGITLTIDSPENIIASPRQQIFSLAGTGAVTFTKSGVVYPEWFGPNTTPGTTDMAAEIQAAVNSNDDNVVQLASGIYAIGTGITAKTHTWFRGVGSQQTATGTELKATAAIDMITYPNSSWYFGVVNMRINGDSTATTGIKIGDGGANAAGSATLWNLYINACAKGIDLYKVYHTDIKALITGCTTYGISLGNDCEHNDIYLWTANNATHIQIDASVFNHVFSNSAHMTGASVTLARLMQITNGSLFNDVTGSFEVEFTPTAGDVVSIDDASNFNTLNRISFATGGAAAQDFDVVQIGVKAADSAASVGNSIKECVFAGQDAGYYDVQLEYANSTLIFKCHDSAATNFKPTIDESDISYALYTKHTPESTRMNKIAVTADRTITTSETSPFWFEVDTTSGNITITVPHAAAAIGATIKIIKLVEANTVTVAKVSGVFHPGSAATLSLTSITDWVTLTSDGTNWIKTGKRITV